MVCCASCRRTGRPTQEGVSGSCRDRVGKCQRSVVVLCLTTWCTAATVCLVTNGVGFGSNSDSDGFAAYNGASILIPNRYY